MGLIGSRGKGVTVKRTGFKIARHLRSGTLRKLQKEARHAQFHFRDLANYCRYGAVAPRFAERIWVNAEECELGMPPHVVRQLTGLHRRKHSSRDASGKVVHQLWPHHEAIPVTEVPTVRFCIEHWVNGVSWENAGAYEHMEKLIAQRGRRVDGCESMEDVVRRYERLDSIFEQVRSEGRLQPDRGGPAIHIGPEGQPFFGGLAFHRFAMAWILNLRFPAQLGCVHHTALPWLPTFRAESPQRQHSAPED